MGNWRVNQNHTYRHEVGEGYLWSPKTNKDGCRNRFYDSMTEAAPGGIVFCLSDTQIKAVGVVTGGCMSGPKPPEFGAAGSNSSDEGWYLLSPTLPDKYPDAGWEPMRRVK